MKNDCLIVKCACHSESLEISYDKECSHFDVSIWYYGRGSKILSWPERFRWIWRILKTGDPWADQIILNKDETKEIVNFLNKY